MTNVECEIRCIIDQAIEGKYIGNLKVYEEDDVWYLLLHLNQDYAPMMLVKQGSYEEFKEFVKSEIKSRRLEKTSYWKTLRETPALVDRAGKLDLDYDNIVIT